MTEIDLDALEARANAATPGPWHKDHDEHGCVAIGDYGWVCAGPNAPAYDVDSEQGKADAEFIAHARVDVPELIEEVRLGDRQINRLNEEIMRAWGEIRHRDKQLDVLREQRDRVLALATDCADASDGNCAWSRKVHAIYAADQPCPSGCPHPYRSHGPDGCLVRVGHCDVCPCTATGTRTPDRQTEEN